MLLLSDLFLQLCFDQSLLLKNLTDVIVLFSEAVFTESTVSSLFYTGSGGVFGQLLAGYSVRFLAALVGFHKVERPHCGGFWLRVDRFSLL